MRNGISLRIIKGNSKSWKSKNFVYLSLPLPYVVDFIILHVRRTHKIGRNVAAATDLASKYWYSRVTLKIRQPSKFSSWPEIYLAAKS